MTTPGYKFSLYLLVCLAACLPVLGKSIKRQVKFWQTVTINNTLVEKGTYDVVFDEEMNELRIIKGKKVVARAPAKMEASELFKGALYMTRRQGDGADGAILTVVALGRDRQATIVGPNGTTASDKPSDKQ